MAQRRMMSLEVIDTDAFLDMPQSSQLLYFHLNARADDDGFVSNPKRIMRDVGSQADDLKLLTAKKFIISFNDGVCIIKHWRVNNFVRKDIYKETQYLNLKQTLFIRPNGAYTQTNDERAIPIPEGHFTLESVDEALTKRQPRIGKGSIGKDNEDKLESSISYLKKIPEDQIEEFYNRFDCDKKAIQNKADALFDWCEANGKRKKNYRAFLLMALRKDFPERKEKPVSRKVIMVDGKPTMII